MQLIGLENKVGIKAALGNTVYAFFDENELIEDDDIRNSEIAFPDEETLARCETFTYLGDDADEVYNQLWREVKSN